jgi:hypothetical protein
MVDFSSWALIRKLLSVESGVGSTGLLGMVVDDAEDVEIVDGGGPLKSIDVQNGVVSEKLGEGSADGLVSSKGGVKSGSVIC